MKSLNRAGIFLLLSLRLGRLGDGVVSLAGPAGRVAGQDCDGSIELSLVWSGAVPPFLFSSPDDEARIGLM